MTRVIQKWLAVLFILMVPIIAPVTTMQPVARVSMAGPATFTYDETHATGDAERYLKAVEIEGSHMRKEGGQ